MCGIAGFIDWRAATSADTLRSLGEKMNETLRHRGPDDAGVWTEAEAGAVAIRLRTGEDLGAIPVENAIALMKQLNDSRALELSTSTGA